MPTNLKDSLAMTYRPANAMLSTANNKTWKGEKEGWLTAILYLSPHTLVSPKTLCPFSTPACREACLYSAGRGAFERTINARVNRTRAWVEDKALVMAQLDREIAHLKGIAKDAGVRLAVRLNGTSDIRWELERVAGFANLMEAHPSVQFYDYTKYPLEHRGPLPANYRLVFSMADDNHDLAVRYLLAGHSVSVVHAHAEVIPPGSAMRLGQSHVALVDGDADDLRFLQEPSSLIILTPKGHRVKHTTLLRADPIGDLLLALARINDKAHPMLVVDGGVA